MAKKLLTSRKQNPADIIVFGDKKTFTVDLMLKRQNSRELTFPHVLLLRLRQVRDHNKAYRLFDDDGHPDDKSQHHQQEEGSPVAPEIVHRGVCRIPARQDLLEHRQSLPKLPLQESSQDRYLLG
ncbi:unnamed protein product [Lepeophtheirus salmonis]|uniref:(salmon louse) hypothetical protein n=1 Tax=Lepeophtheirus salmonis TaxID=72036 RepID=A0A7R8D175_LEPSM|nr:unnamed protein product [Lepeophtheirus salmonis]CAF2992970.1 unnamed protein product [Lepeophtheirus salmonis]